MSTSTQQAGTLSFFPRVCASRALLLSVYEWMAGRACREHLSGEDPLWHTMCALPVLLSIYKQVVGRASRWGAALGLVMLPPRPSYVS